MAPPTPHPPLPSCFPPLGRPPANHAAVQPTPVGHLATSTAGACARNATSSYPSATPAPLSCQQPVMTRLTTPMFDSSIDPLSWLSLLQLPFKLHHVPQDQEVWYATFHLTGAAQLWYIFSMTDEPIPEWDSSHEASSMTLVRPSARTHLVTSLLLDTLIP
jgi:hypothetical protein